MKALLLFLLSCNLFAADFSDHISRSKWGDFESVWFKDERFPLYSLTIFFNEGALNEGKKKAGQTQAALNLLDSGSSKYNQKEISEFFDFYGISYSAYVSHEYSSFTFSGLVKDFPKTVEMVCHLFNEATYPEQEVKNYKKRSLSDLRNLISSPQAVADRALRHIEMRGTDYFYPTGGTIYSIRKFTSDALKSRVKELAKDSTKRFYYLGPKLSEDSQKLFLEKCGWTQKDKKVSEVKPIKKNAKKGHIYLVPVPDSNQAQIRLGKVIPKELADKNRDVYTFISSYLGGGFTSKLVQELRVKRGLTYSANSYISTQKNYGRVGISTFSKNPTVIKTLNEIKRILNHEASKEGMDEQSFEHNKRYVIGSHPFTFESTSSFLGLIIGMDHQGRELDEIYNFPRSIRKIKTNQAKEVFADIFNWDELNIIVVGDKSLKEQLETIRPVRVLPVNWIL